MHTVVYDSSEPAANDFGFARIAEENDIILIDASAVQASNGQRDNEYGTHMHNQRERLLYLTLLDNLFSDKIFVSPGVGEEIRFFLRDLPEFPMPGRYRRMLSYVLDKISGRVIETTDDEKECMQRIATVTKSSRRLMSDQDYEMLLYGLALANHRGTTGILTNDAVLRRVFSDMSYLLKEAGYEQRNRLTVYSKFRRPKFGLESTYPF